MSQRGPKPMSKDIKIAKGSYQACRDAPKHLVIDAPPPQMPNYLTQEAQAVWFEELDRVVKAGTTELDSSLFADYCGLAAIARDQLSNGQQPQATIMTELRKMRELLGIAGVPSRSQRGTPTVKEISNPFAALKRP